ncbi:MAG: cation:proton antiporter, partial [Thermomicrobiaceae bacterium]|nr:cation:proton antiporter [Thermomicrobiaceae bacterium]
MVSDVSVVTSLLVVVGVVLVARRLDLPYTLALVVTGLLLGALDLAPEIVLTPHLVFLVLLPPLLFEASFNLDYGTLRRDAPLIALLAVPGVALGALAIAALLH